jgi:primosomal protein N' (replication factor Y)
MLVSVLTIPATFVKGELLYFSDSDCAYGDVIRVPFGSDFKYALVVFTFSNQSEIEQKIEQEKIDRNKIKNIDKKISLNFDKEFINFLHKFSQYNCIKFTDALDMTIGDEILNRISKKNQEIRREQENLTTNISLSKEQKFVAEGILKSSYSTNLIHGVTGSGKTSVYCYVVSEVLKKNNDSQALIMFPEIALSKAIIDEMKSIFGIEIISWNSNMTPKQRYESFCKIYDGSAKIIVGTRSAILLPYKKLGIIVIDEEHDNSYKQQDGHSYNSRDMAIMRAKQLDIPIILSSATPSLETYYNATEINKYNYYSLKNRYGSAKMPNVDIIGINKKNLSFLSDISIELIRKELEAGKQSLIFLNKRGYARYLECSRCKFVPNCENCDNKLVFHKQKTTLNCHYCGYVVKFRNKCSQCDNDEMITKGLGVEKVKEELDSILIDKNPLISIYSSDTLSSNNKYDKKIEEIYSNEAKIIVGTQVISKGYNFKHLGLVIIIDYSFDSNDNDFRYDERLFQMFSQVIGRAGRYDDQGKVLIQTDRPNNDTLKIISEHSVEAFYKKELIKRKSGNLPPFSRDIDIVISGIKADFVEKDSHQIYRQLISDLRHNNLYENILFMGISQSYKIYIKRKYRWIIKLRIKNYSSILSVFLVNFVEKNSNKNIKIKIDIDPKIVI